MKVNLVMPFGFSFLNIFDKGYVMSNGVFLQDFWNPGDGSDYSNAFQRALDSGEHVIYGSGREYVVSGGFSGRSNLTIRDMKLIAPNLQNNSPIISFNGTFGVPQRLGSTLQEGSYSIVVPDGSKFVADEWVWLQSEDYWACPTLDNVKYGEQIRIAAVVGNTLFFYGSNLLRYDVTKDAQIIPIKLIKNVVLENVSLIGPYAGQPNLGNQSGLVFKMCSNVCLQNVYSEEFDYAHIIFERSNQCRVVQGGANKTGHQEGLDYGIVVANGCYDIIIDSYSGSKLRHVSTIGGAQGVSRFITVTNCRGSSLTDAGIDAHSAVHEHTFSNNYLHFSDDVDVTIDGIISQGSQPLIFGNTIVNPKRHGIMWQPEILDMFTGSLIGNIFGNTVERKRIDGSSVAYLIQTPTTQSGCIFKGIDALNIDSILAGNGWSTGVLIRSFAAPINNIRINMLFSGRAFIRAMQIIANGSSISNIDISGTYRSSGAYETVYLQSNNSNKIKNIVLKNPIVDGKGIGIRLLGVENIREAGAIFVGCSSRYLVDPSSTNYELSGSSAQIYWRGGKIEPNSTFYIDIPVSGLDIYDVMTDISLGQNLQGIDINGEISSLNLIRISLDNRTGSAKVFSESFVTVITKKIK